MMLRQIRPYIFIAGICAGLNISIMISGDALGLQYALATSVSFITCVCVGYFLHCRYTFARKPTLEGLRRYTMAMSINYPLSLVTIGIFYGLAGLPMTRAAPLSTAATVIINFALARWAIVQPARVRN
jgi:putative flippase GtrA